MTEEVSVSPQCPFEVWPLPYAWCKGCLFNGCYPWNRNPLLLCSKLGGIFPAIIMSESHEPKECLQYKPVTEDSWKSHLDDLKKEATTNEDLRERATKSKVWSSDLLPAEYLDWKHRHQNLFKEHVSE